MDGELNAIMGGAVCVLYKGSEMARLVRVVTLYSSSGDYRKWSTRPYLDRGYPSKIVSEYHLTPLTEMEVLAWAAQS
jgi:hypothetical protein